MLKKVIKMNPNLAKAHKDLGIIFLNKRLFDYAEDEFKIALNLAPNDFEILFEYGNFLYSTSKNTDAERYYGEALEVEVDVANVGDRKGTLTLQLYIHDVAAEVTRPVKELKHVEKVRLEAGEKRTLKISLAPESFEYYHFDRTLHADPGEFLIWAAEDSAHGESVKFRLV